MNAIATNLIETFTLPPLPYATDALEPFIDKATMEIHHDRHHAAYVSNLNNALTGTEAAGKMVEEILKGISKYPPAVRNNGGGHYNHSLFWSVMSANSSGIPSGEIALAINNTFSSFEAFKEAFAKAAMGRFGSGWAWLVSRDGKVFITTTPNQDNPLMDTVPEKERGTPILGLDLWEHAYYLKYQNKRPDYIAAWWNVINWDEVAQRYLSTMV